MYRVLQMLDMPIQLGSKGTTGELDEWDWLNEGVLIFQGPLIKFPTRAKCDTHQSLSASNWRKIWQVKDNSIPWIDIPQIPSGPKLLYRTSNRQFYR